MTPLLLRLQLASAALRTVVLLVEDGEPVDLDAIEELRRIESFLDRISAKVEPGRGIGGIA